MTYEEALLAKCIDKAKRLGLEVAPRRNAPDHHYNIAQQLPSGKWRSLHVAASPQEIWGYLKALDHWGTPALTPWENDEVQFARLLCEIAACQDNLDHQALCEAMDIDVDDLNALFDRAHKTWEEAKRVHCG